MDRRIFGEWVRFYRTLHGLQQEELAEQVGCSVPTISRTESGTQNIGVDLVFALARALAVAPKAFFADDQDAMPKEAMLYLQLMRSTRKLPDLLRKSLVTMVVDVEEALRPGEGMREETSES